MDVTESKRDPILELKKALGASSKKEVLRRAVVLLEMAMKIRKEGGQVLFRDKKDGLREIIV